MINKQKPKTSNAVPLEDLIEPIFSTPKIVGICADIGQGKSNMIYAMLHYLQTKFNFTEKNLYTYALPLSVGQRMIFSVEELELIEDSLIVLDEFFLFLNLDDRKRVKQLAEMMQRIKHANNVLVLCGLPHNFNKFISSQLSLKIYKQTTIKNLINGSPMKDVVAAYNGSEKGSTILRLPPDQALVYGLEGASTGIPHYTLTNVPFMKEFDVKASLPPILVPR